MSKNDTNLDLLRRCFKIEVLTKARYKIDQNMTTAKKLRDWRLRLKRNKSIRLKIIIEDLIIFRFVSECSHRKGED
jgi:hypothetical protein